MKMTTPAKNISPDSKLFFERDLSWLDFNSRVLDEAANTAVPLLERIKFLAISAGNLDEFFMVRVATLLKMAANGDLPSAGGMKPSEQLPEIRRKVKSILKRQYQCAGNILDELQNKLDVRMIKSPAEYKKSSEGSKHLFKTQILPALTPIAATAGRSFPLINADTLQLAAAVENGCIFIEVPASVPRFIEIKSDDGKRKIVTVENIICAHIRQLLPGRKIRAVAPFVIHRDMDVDFEDDSVPNLIKSIGKWLKERKFSEIIHLEVPENIDPELFKFLKKSFAVKNSLCYKNPDIIHGKNLMQLPELINDRRFVEKKWLPAKNRLLAGNIFDAIKKEKEILLAVPFQSFDPITKLILQAAKDPDVLAIKQTLYRVSGNSPVVKALQTAAANGKQVTVLVELKARFDEYNNIAWAKKLDRSGAHVIYGVPGLKVHCKMLMIVRREKDGIRRYLHLGTGNYNDKTALQYTDCGIFTSDETCAGDAAELFNILTGENKPGKKFKNFAVAPFGLRKRFEKAIKREIKLTESGKPGRIIAKMNSLSDPKIIKLLHRAANAGVEMDLIVRGICCLRPQPDRPNCRIYSIVDRYLEHSRIYFFGNGGQGEYYLSSADWMTRNLDCRIEIMFPVKSEKVKSQLQTILDLSLADNCKKRQLLSDGTYTSPAGNSDSRSQYLCWKFFKENN